MSESPQDPFERSTPGETKLANGQLVMEQLLQLTADDAVRAILELDRDDLEDIVLFIWFAEASVVDAIRKGNARVSGTYEE